MSYLLGKQSYKGLSRSEVYLVIPSVSSAVSVLALMPCSYIKQYLPTVLRSLVSFVVVSCSLSQPSLCSWKKSAVFVGLLRPVCQSCVSRMVVSDRPLLFMQGGFDPNLVSTASIFKAEESAVNGKPYYYLAVLTRTGDGTEGGRHQYIVSTVSAGKLYILKAQAGDKRWFKGTNKFVEGAASSFTVA